jgi:hypothetical protein
VCLSCVLGVVAQPLRRAETLVFFFWVSCGPFAARGAKGEAEYLSRWLGGTGERSTVGEQERRGGEGQGKQRGSSSEESGRQRYDRYDEVKCIFIIGQF